MNSYIHTFKLKQKLVWTKMQHQGKQLDLLLWVKWGALNPSLKDVSQTLHLWNQLVHLCISHLAWILLWKTGYYCSGELNSDFFFLFWHLLSEEDYLCIRRCAFCHSALFAPTYLCQSAFFHMETANAKFRWPRIGLSETTRCCTYDYEKLAASSQCKSSN